MAASKRFLHPSADHILKELGNQIRIARKQQYLTQREMAKQSGIGRTIIQSIEQGRPGVGLTAYLQILFALGLESQLLKIFSGDPVTKIIKNVP